MEVPIARPPASLLALIACAFSAFAALSAPVAEAAPKRPVRIETDPPGATVYVGDKESGAAGVTPLDLRLPPGEHTVILELIGHLPRFEVIQVTGGAAKKPQVVSFTLEPAVATIVVDGSDMPTSARVFVDGEERGALPARIEVEPGAHQVEVIAEGRRPFEAWVEVAGGAEETVEVVLRGADAPARSEPAVEAAAPRSRPSLLAAGAGFELGWRRFRYQEPITSNAQPFDADGVGLIALWIELHPQRALGGARLLWPLSLVASYRHGLPLETDLQGDAVADANWRAADIGLRYRIDLGPWVAVDLDAGWARTQFSFTGEDGGEVAEVPDVDYQALRLGGRVLARPGDWSFWVGAENQIVLDGGRVEDRFRGAEVDGYGLRGGLQVDWLRGRIVTRAEATWNHYGWLFDPAADDEFQATGGSDDLYGLSLAVGATY
jgi:hypothetical protein